MIEFTNEGKSFEVKNGYGLAQINSKQKILLCLTIQ
jgi:hypothetical protein